MSKKSDKNQLKQYDALLGHGDIHSDTPLDEEVVVGMMGSMLEASNNQMLIAIELTKLIVGSNPVKNMEDHVFAVFKKATKVIGEAFPLGDFLAQLDR